MYISTSSAILNLIWSLLAIWIAAILVPIKPFLIFTIVLVVADLYTGIKAAAARNEIIKSLTMRRSVSKLIHYFIAILLTQGFKLTFDIPFNIVYMTAGMIALAEIKSVFENIHVVTGVELWHQFSERVFSIFDIFKKK